MNRGGQRLPTSSKLLNNLLKFDRFRVPFKLIMPGNSEDYRSILGTFFTLLVFSIVMSYASYKMISWDSYTEYDLM